MNIAPHKKNVPLVAVAYSAQAITAASLFMFTPLVASASAVGEEYALPSINNVLFAVGAIVIAVIVFAALLFISKKVHGDGKPSNKHTISYLINNDMPLSVFDFDFMYLNYDISKLYESIKTKYRHIKSSPATLSSKNKSEVLMLVAGNTLDSLREPNEVTLEKTHTDKEIALAQLREIEAGLLKIIDDDSNRLDYSATDRVMPDSYILQERLDYLRIIAADILYKANNGAYSEEDSVAMTSQLFNTTLIKLHDDYLDIKKPNIHSDEDTVFMDVALAAIFDEVSEFFHRINAGMGDDDNSLAVAEILKNDDFFKQKIEAATESEGFYAR